MKLYPDSKIYIFAPSGHYSGGPKSLHQLCSAIRSLNLDAYMTYYRGTDFDRPMHPQFEKYHLPVVEGVEDSPHNIAIVPESKFFEVGYLTEIQIVIWWLSVDFFFLKLEEQLHHFIQAREFLKTPFQILQMPSIRFSEMDHLYHDEYVRQFLKLNGFPTEKCFPVGDYLFANFYEQTDSIDLNAKEDLIVYNPKKGLEFTKQLINAAPDLNFVPIENMTPTQVQSTLARAKIYIDFGFHPGRDHLPREAVMSHCVVVTGKRGSAANDIDVPISEEFKFDDSIGSEQKIIPKIVKRLRVILKKFRSKHDKQNSYRGEVQREQDKFFMDVANLFQIDSNEKLPEKVAVVGNDLDKIVELIQSNPDQDFVFVVNDNFNGKFLKFDDRRIEIISSSDAVFLFNERRIDRFLSL